MTTIDRETRDQWREDAERDADATRDPSGYYPSARIVALLEALDAAEDRADSIQATLDGFRDIARRDNELLIARAEAAEAKLAKIRGLHRRSTSDDGTCQGYDSTGYGYIEDFCVACSDISGREYGVEWPCPTAVILDGQADS